jgi:hypothetical protein
VTRYSFVVQVHPGGVSTLENLATRERVKIDGFETVGLQIERWLEEPQADALLPVAGQDDGGDAAPR